MIMENDLSFVDAGLQYSMLSPDKEA